MTKRKHIKVHYEIYKREQNMVLNVKCHERRVQARGDKRVGLVREVRSNCVIIK